MSLHFVRRTTGWDVCKQEQQLTIITKDEMTQLEDHCIYFRLILLCYKHYWFSMYNFFFSFFFLFFFLQISQYKYMKSKVGRFILEERDVLGSPSVEGEKKKKKSQISRHFNFSCVVLSWWLYTYPTGFKRQKAELSFIYC